MKDNVLYEKYGIAPGNEVSNETVLKALEMLKSVKLSYEEFESYKKTIQYLFDEIPIIYDEMTRILSIVEGLSQGMLKVAQHVDHLERLAGIQPEKGEDYGTK